MKNIFLLCLLVLGAAVKAQIGIGTTTPNSTLDVRGSLSTNLRSFTASTTATTTDYTLLFTGTAAATLTLPDATTCTGRIYILKNSSITVPVPVLTITPAASQLLDVSNSYLLDDVNETITITSNGTGWNLTTVAFGKTRSNFFRHRLPEL